MIVRHSKQAGSTDGSFEGKAKSRASRKMFLTDSQPHLALSEVEDRKGFGSWKERDGYDKSGDKVRNIAQLTWTIVKQDYDIMKASYDIVRCSWSSRVDDRNGRPWDVLIC